ncbi:hypothetical protein [Parathermosynechococcus lividus]
MLTGVNTETQASLEAGIDLNGHHDCYFGNIVIEIIPEDGLGIMDRGVASFRFINQLIALNTLFVLRIKC